MPMGNERWATGKASSYMSGKTISGDHLFVESLNFLCLLRAVLLPKEISLSSSDLFSERIRHQEPCDLLQPLETSMFSRRCYIAPPRRTRNMEASALRCR